MILKKILIVEDEKEIRELLLAIFSDQKDYEVGWATDGQEAHKIILSGKLDMVILDINLPGLSGDRLCQMVKADPALKQVKILMLSGLAQRYDFLKAQAEGADGYLTKPFHAQELLETVSRLARTDK